MTFKILWHGFNLLAAEKSLFEAISGWIGVCIGPLPGCFSKDLPPGAAARGAAAGNVPFRISL
jgi:hypothetical protein